MSFMGWRREYSRRIKWVDALSIGWAIGGAYVFRFQTDFLSTIPNGDVTYAFFAVVLAVIWWGFLGAWGSRDSKVLGIGAEEYKAVFSASLWLFGVVAILSYAFQIDIARGFVGVALPAGLVAVPFGRWVVRQRLKGDRLAGSSTSRVMVVGGPHATSHLVRSLLSQPGAGYRPVAAYLTGFRDAQLDDDLSTPVLGYEPEVEKIVDAIGMCKADTVAVSSGSVLNPTDLRRLGWELARLDVSLILAPALTDVAGPRIHTQPVAGLPLIHVSTPRLTGPKRLVKRSFDIVASLVLLTVLSPAFMAIAMLIKLSSPGPIFYTQERIGIRGETFRMVKFRSMRVNADAELQSLLVGQGSSGKPLFKVENDPRITPVGKILRKYSLDELPQLFNVVYGTMSLVGPRPQREGEVALYDDSARRRLYVSPGMSGLWQVSGRSNLTWEQAIRLDLYYVENWSLTQDLLILFKTFKAVFTSDGAV